MRADARNAPVPGPCFSPSAESWPPTCTKGLKSRFWSLRLMPAPVSDTTHLKRTRLLRLVVCSPSWSIERDDESDDDAAEAEAEAGAAVSSSSHTKQVAGPATTRRRRTPCRRRRPAGSRKTSKSSWTLPPRGVNLTAFMIRFVRIWRMRVVSPHSHWPDGTLVQSYCRRTPCVCTVVQRARARACVRAHQQQHQDEHGDDDVANDDGAFTPARVTPKRLHQDARTHAHT
jgi:hypothetical protein